MPWIEILAQEKKHRATVPDFDRRPVLQQDTLIKPTNAC
jgi:hypothetical protein